MALADVSCFSFDPNWMRYRGIIHAADVGIQKGIQHVAVAVCVAELQLILKRLKRFVGKSSGRTALSFRFTVSASRILSASTAER